jgi:hypothetical protein
MRYCNGEDGCRVHADADVRIDCLKEGQREKLGFVCSDKDLDREEICSTNKRSRVTAILLCFLMANNAEDLHEENEKGR